MAGRALARQQPFGCPQSPPKLRTGAVIRRRSSAAGSKFIHVATPKHRQPRVVKRLVSNWYREKGKTRIADRFTDGTAKPKYSWPHSAGIEARASVDVITLRNSCNAQPPLRGGVTTISRVNRAGLRKP